MNKINNMNTDYEKRRAEEFANMRARLATALQVGKLLGAKYETPEDTSQWQRDANFTLPGKPYSLTISWSEYRHEGKFRVSARFEQIRDARNQLVSLKWHFDKIGNTEAGNGAVEYASIGISHSKSPEVIAAQIRSRLLSEMDKGVETFYKVRQDTIQMDSKFAGVVTRMQKVMLGRAPDQHALTSGSVGDYKFGAVVSKYNDCPIKLSIDDLTESQATEIIKFVQSLKIAKAK